MTDRSPAARLTDVVETIALIRGDMAGVTRDAFQSRAQRPADAEAGAGAPTRRRNGTNNVATINATMIARKASA